MVGCHPWIGCAQELGQPLFFSLHSAARQASHPNFLLLGFRASPKFPPSCVIPRVAFSKTLEPRQGLERPEDPQDKSQAPGKEAPEGQKERFTPQGGEEHGRGFAPLGLGYCLRKAGQAYAGGLVLSSMSSMATAIRNSTMRCWGPRGPHSTTLQRRHPLFSPRDGVCPCRVSSGCWPPRNGWETA